MTAPRSSLASLAHLSRDPDPDGAWKMMERLWKEYGIAVFMPDEVDRKRGFLRAQEVRNLAKECYEGEVK